MSGEASYQNVGLIPQQQHQNTNQSTSQINYMKLLSILFQPDVNTSTKSIDAVFDQFEKIFRNILFY